MVTPAISCVVFSRSSQVGNLNELEPLVAPCWLRYLVGVLHDLDNVLVSTGYKLGPDENSHLPRPSGSSLG